MRLWLAALISIVMPTPAQARWLQAESEHFVIYAEDSEDDLQHFAEMLERYHVAMERLTGKQTETPSPSNRVTIFVLRNEREIREAYGGNDRFVAGFCQAFAPVVADPHCRARAEIARRSLAELIAAEEGKPFRLALLADQETDARAAGENPPAGTE